MSATQLRAELLQELIPIFDNEKAMTEVLNLVRHVRITYYKPAEKSVIREERGTIKRSSRLQWLHDNPLRLSSEDLKDDKTQYILSK